MKYRLAHKACYKKTLLPGIKQEKHINQVILGIIRQVYNALATVIRVYLFGSLNKRVGFFSPVLEEAERAVYLAPPERDLEDR